MSQTIAQILEDKLQADLNAAQLETALAAAQKALGDAHVAAEAKTAVVRDALKRFGPVLYTPKTGTPQIWIIDNNPVGYRVMTPTDAAKLVELSTKTN